MPYKNQATLWVMYDCTNRYAGERLHSCVISMTCRQKKDPLPPTLRGTVGGFHKNILGFSLKGAKYE